jgi:hypothetical protein
MMKLNVMMHAKLYSKLTSSNGKKKSTRHAKLTQNQSNASRPKISRMTLRNPVAKNTTPVMKQRELSMIQQEKKLIRLLKLH